LLSKVGARGGSGGGGGGGGGGGEGDTASFFPRMRRSGAACEGRNTGVRTECGHQSSAAGRGLRACRQCSPWASERAQPPSYRERDAPPSPGPPAKRRKRGVRTERIQFSAAGNQGLQAVRTFSGGGDGSGGAASFLPRMRRSTFSGTACEARKRGVRTAVRRRLQQAVQGLQAVRTFAGGGGGGAGFGGGGATAGLLAARPVGASLPLVADRISARSFSWSAFASAATSLPALATTAGPRQVRAGDCSDRTDGCSTSAEVCRSTAAMHKNRNIAPTDL
jgi:hypothetical protein